MDDWILWEKDGAAEGNKTGGTAAACEPMPDITWLSWGGMAMDIKESWNWKYTF